MMIANDTCAPCSHNILLYEDGHAVVADFGGEQQGRKTCVRGG